MLQQTLTKPLICGMAAALAAVLGWSGPAIAQSGGAPPDIASGYQSIDGALAQRDPEPLIKLYTPTAIFIDATGHIHPLSEVASNIRAEVKASQSIESTTTPGDAIVQKSGVTVPITQKIEITSIEAKTGVLDTTILTLNERDHWIQVGGSWKINRERILSASAQTNGQPSVGTM